MEFIKIKREQEETKDTDDGIKKRKSVVKGITKSWLKNDKRCEDCGIQIKFRQNIRRHMEMNCLALGMRDKFQKKEKKEKVLYTCRDCGIQIQHRQNVKRHRDSCPALGKIKEKAKTLPCDECGERYTHKDDLRKHQKKIHWVKQQIESIL